MVLSFSNAKLSKISNLPIKSKISIFVIFGGIKENSSSFVYLFDVYLFL